MANAADSPISKRTLAGRLLAGVWAINFVLMVTDTFTFSGQSGLSFGLAIGAVALLVQR